MVERTAEPLPCEKCGSLMIRASFYDPEGSIPLYGGLQRVIGGHLREWWICTNPSCEDGKRNIQR